MVKLRFLKGSREERITVIICLMIFVGNAFLCVFPIFWTFINALKTGEEFFANNLALPQNWLFKNFINVFELFVVRDYYYTQMLFNSLWMLTVNVLVNVGASLLLAYPLARYKFPGSNFLYLLVIAANTIPIIGSGAAGYKLMVNLNMINNPALIWIAWASAFDFAFIIFYGTLKGISPAYSEAAKLDGASNFRICYQIVLPQAIAPVIAICITQAIGVWNNYSISMITMRDYPTLAYGLYLFNTESNYIENSKPIFFSAALISCVPVIVLYATNMKFIMNNVTAGGLKG